MLVSPCPSAQLVVDCFRWRQEDSRRNALGAYAYWEQRKRGVSQTGDPAAGGMVGQTRLVAAFGIDFRTLPAWQKFGTGVFWETHEKEGRNPLTGESVMTTRQRLRREEMGCTAAKRCGRFVRGFLQD